MKRRPTEIPYIPKDKRRSRFAAREGGRILASNKGVEALRQTNDNERAKPEKKQSGGCGCLVFMLVAWTIFSDGGLEFVRDLIEDVASRIQISIDD